MPLGTLVNIYFKYISAPEFHFFYCFFFFVEISYFIHYKHISLYILEHIVTAAALNTLAVNSNDLRLSGSFSCLSFLLNMGHVLLCLYMSSNFELYSSTL